MITTHREIVDYWSKHQDECDLSVDWSEAESLCWRCAHERLLQRCHIVPRALGGSEAPDNLVLLCAQCHAEAPNVVDPDFMWVWLRAHAVPCYGTYWHQRGFREYELIFGETPFAGLEPGDGFLDRARLIFKELYPGTSTHWGQGNVNPATLAWILRKIDQSARHETCEDMLHASRDTSCC